MRRARETVSDDMLLSMPGWDWCLANRYATLARFGMWDDMVAEPAPNSKLRRSPEAICVATR
ncbi:MAG TPA: hypothetical protein VJS67_03495 [Pseudonocardiaceae bacterium]|nr:hypothetical protein [Pseudonocardiaceae bacterium]